MLNSYLVVTMFELRMAILPSIYGVYTIRLLKDYLNLWYSCKHLLSFDYCITIAFHPFLSIKGSYL